MIDGVEPRRCRTNWRRKYCTVTDTLKLQPQLRTIARILPYCGLCIELAGAILSTVLGSLTCYSYAVSMLSLTQDQAEIG